MNVPPMVCPKCGQPPSPVSGRGDFFCRGCHGTLVLLDDTFALWQEAPGEEQALIPLVSLQAVENRG